MGPLSEVLVLDLSRVLAGPYCTMILGDLGADVIKIEHPDGDETRTWGPPFIDGESAYYLSVNRNKRSVVADFGKREDLDLILRIARRADVLVENFLPGALERAGISLQELRSANPRLITITISGMGVTGPDRDLAGYDFIIQAASGLMAITGPAEGPASKVGVAVVDLTAGMMAANAVLAALYSRERTGEGQHIDISLMETAVSWLANVGTAHLLTGKEPTRHGNAHPTIVPYQLIRTSTGDVALGVGNDNQFQRFCDALELQKLTQDARFKTNANRVTNRAQLIEEIENRTANLSAQVVVEKLREVGVPVSLVRKVSEALNDPQVIARAMIQSVQHPKIGEIKLLGIPYKFSNTPAQIRRHPPLLGEHTQEVRNAFK
ncbi:MAG TPA: CoA transferase [Longimicrobiales bacterium]|nr:CoA transferase [Longimicrobiales bacterium]